MALNYKSIVTSSVSKQIALDIRDAILDGRLVAGAQLPTEDELARRYQVSRPTIREALKLLAAQHLIRARRGPAGGTFVVKPDISELGSTLAASVMLMTTLDGFGFDELAETRLQLEILCCQAAVKHRTEEDLGALRQALADLRDDAKSDEEFCAADVRFHRLIVDSTHMRPLGLLMYGVVEAMLPIMNLVVNRERERAAILNYHERILGAISARDEAEAAAALEGLIGYLRERFAAAQARGAARRRAADA